MAGHIENFYYLMAKVRAHYLRLPKELQKRIELGLVKSFEQVSTLTPEVPKSQPVPSLAKSTGS